MSKTQAGHIIHRIKMYAAIHTIPFSRPEKFIIFFPAIPHKLPPAAKVNRMRKSLLPFTFHLSLNFLNILQMCRNLW